MRRGSHFLAFCTQEATCAQRRAGGRARGEGGGREVHSNLREEKGGDEKDPC